MKKFSIALAAVAALALASSTLFACDAHKTADASGKDTKACCAKKGATTAGGAKCAAHADKAKMASGASCTMAPGAKKTEVAMTGKLLCEHCNLHKTEGCNPVFQAAGSEKFLSICPDTDVAAVKKASAEGKNVLDVKGYLCKNTKGEEMLMISTFAVKS